MDAADIMTRFVVTMPPGATMKAVAKELAQHAISGMSVVDDDGKLLGIITEGRPRAAVDAQPGKAA